MLYIRGFYSRAIKQIVVFNWEVNKFFITTFSKESVKNKYKQTMSIFKLFMGKRNHEN